jgi:hypothetical protein
MTGAADHESALDGPIDGRYHGAFSSALLKSLAGAPAGAGPRLLFRGVEDEMRRLGEQWMIAGMPDPQLEAPESRLDSALLPPLAGAAAPARLAWAEIAVDAESKAVTLDAGALGAVPGSVWALYPPGELAFEPERSAALGEVTAVEGGRARLALRPADAAVVPGSRAVLASPPPAPEELPVRILGLDAERARELAEELRAALPGFESVGPDEFAQLHVELDGPSLRVLGADGTTLVAAFRLAPDERPAAKLVAVHHRCLDAAALMALDNPSARMQLEVRIGAPVERAATRVGTRGFKVVGENGPPTFRFKDGARSAKNSLQLSVRSSADCWLTIVDVDAEGALNLLFPSPHARAGFLPDGRIAAGAWHALPDALDDPNAAGFWWDAGPPAGLDTIRVFASTDRAFAEELRAALRDLEKDAAGLAERGLTRELHASRRAGLGRLRRAMTTRGFKVVGAAADAPSATPPAAPPPDGSPAGTPAEAPAGAAEDPPPAAEPEDFDWKATSVTARIEAP